MRTLWIALFRAAVGLGALAAFLATAVPVTLGNAGRLALQARENARLGAAEAHGRLLGESFVRSLDEIRRRIPEDGAYFLLDGWTAEEGSALWVRYELAPRRALLLGRNPMRIVRRHPLDWAVIANPPGTPARLLSRQELLDQLDRNAGRPAP